jgi:hypothetical protein
MAFTNPSKTRNVRGISEQDKSDIRTYLQGAVYTWIKNRKNEFFAARDLVGGVNFHWEGTPPYKLYLKHAGKGAGAVKAAGKDLGWLLKEMLAADNRTFERGRKGLTCAYRWIGIEASRLHAH